MRISEYNHRKIRMQIRIEIEGFEILNDTS